MLNTVIRHIIRKTQTLKGKFGQGVPESLTILFDSERQRGIDIKRLLEPGNSVRSRCCHRFDPYKSAAKTTS